MLKDLVIGKDVFDIRKEYNMDNRNTKPIQCIERNRANDLVGKSILWANTKENLGNYGTLIGFDEKTGKFLVKNSHNAITYKCIWIVEWEV